MRVAVRSDVFETNSSSVHAIVVDTSEGFLDISDQKSFRDEFCDTSLLDGKLCPEKFGRGYAQMRVDADSRLRYLWSAVRDLCTEKYLRTGEVYEGIYNLKCWERKILSIFPDSVTIDFDEKTEEHFGFIDHTDDLEKFLIRCFCDRGYLRAFILGKASFLLIGSDELYFAESWKKLAISGQVDLFDSENFWDSFEKFVKSADGKQIVYLKGN